MLTQVQRAGFGPTPPHFPVRLTLVTTIILSDGGINMPSSPVDHSCIFEGSSSSVSFAGELRWAADCLRESCTQEFYFRHSAAQSLMSFFPCFLMHMFCHVGMARISRTTLAMCLAALLLSHCLLETSARSLPAGRTLQQLSSVTQPLVGGCILSPFGLHACHIAPNTFPMWL